ncbi:glycosyltransferase [Micromonospora sp. NPDC007230]|uniref:glycosyltransferase n=1 Tax=Micromonospora sp. NPDC007230 TaxID=3364237 RepID=UPI0036A48548
MSSRGDDRRPRVLYLSFYFPPSRASGVYRARATANHLVEQGFDVTVCAAPLRFLYDVVGSVDEELATTVDPRITVERPGMDMFRWEHDLRRYGRFRGTLPVLARRLHDWRKEKLFPEQYASWAWACVRRALQLHRRERFDVVLATGNPHAAFAAAWLFRRLTGVPYVLDYRDAWTLNLFTDSPAYPPGHPAGKWERRVLRGAANTVFVNQALRAWHAERYPQLADRMMVVPNGWDADLMEVEEFRPRPAGPLRFGYLGTLTVNQPVEQMAAAFRQARTHPELADAELNIYGHLGFFRNSPSALREPLGLDPHGDEQSDDEAGIHIRGPVPKTDVGRVYRDSDVLVFLAGGGRYVTSGKIFEYMASGRPIVSVHAPDIAAREVLEGYPLWFTADSLEVDALAQSMVAAGKAARDLTTEQVAQARQHAAGLTRQALLRPLSERLRALAGVPAAETESTGR